MGLCLRLAAFLLCALLGAAAPLGAKPSPRLFGIGLADSYSSITTHLNADPGIREYSEKKHHDGSREARFWLKDESFVRAIFKDPGNATLPAFLSFDLGKTSRARPLDVTQILGKPDFTRMESGGTTTIWGGSGNGDAGVTPRAGASFVVEVTASSGKPLTVIFAVPSWFESQGGS